MKEGAKKWKGSGQDFYRETGEIMDALIGRRASLKNLVFNHPQVKDRKKMYALCCRIIAHYDILDYISMKTGFYKEFSKGLALVVAFEASGIVERRRLLCGGKIKNFVASKRKILEKVVLEVREKFDFSGRSWKAPDIPKYLRVNVNLMMNSNDDDFRLEKVTVKKDDHIENLYRICGKSQDLHRHPFIISKKLLIQDKSSCLPAAILNPPSNAVVLDACAAPGNKTSHLSAIMEKGKGGCIRALEIDPKRYEMLSKNLKEMGCENVQAFNLSFLEESLVSQFQDTEYILLDPSCSGSGMVNQMERMLDSFDTDEERKKERLLALSEFQLNCVRKAISFPNVKKIVYSTCSIHREENEMVIEQILSESPDFALCSFPKEFHSLPGYDGKGMLRMDPKVDKTNGFFVALLQRK